MKFRPLIIYFYEAYNFLQTFLCFVKHLPRYFIDFIVRLMELFLKNSLVIVNVQTHYFL